MADKKCYCILPAGDKHNPTVLALIEDYRIKHSLPEIIIISPEDFKNQKFTLSEHEIQLHTDLILKSIDKYDPYPNSILNEEIRFNKEQNKYRERNYKPNLKFRRK